MKNDLTISIITVSYNAIKTIEQTIRSVISQTYENIEYIIIDGGSTDGTVDIIKKYAEQITFWVTESDDGIYDAMNKGIDVATGDYVYFLGSDDFLANEDVIEFVAEYIKNREKVGFFYGKIYGYNAQYRLKKLYGKELCLEDIQHGSMPPHQAVFARIDIIKNKFNCTYKIAADYEFILRIILNGEKFVYIDKVIAFYNIKGVSSMSMNCSYEYKDIIMEKYILGENIYISIFVVMNAYGIVIRKYIKKIIQKILGEKLFLKITGWHEF